MKPILLMFSIMLSLTPFSKITMDKKEKIATTETDSLTIANFFKNSLTKGKSYDWLRDLTTNVGGRLSGSPEAQKAVIWGENLLKSLNFDKVWLQPVMVPHWVRGEKEKAYFTVNNTKYDVPICALGGSIATSKNGVIGEVVEVKSLKEATEMGEKLKGKIVFFNRPFDDALLNTFHAYGGCVDQRYSGAATVGKFGALAVIVRSMTSSIDDNPHTGAMSYGSIPENEKIPNAAISTNAANLLSKKLKENPNLKFYFKQSCQTLPDEPSFNVIGEIKGSVFPNKYITVGGHLDSWDLAQGAHDDGAGIVQSIEVLRLLKLSGIKPKHTIRVVLFMNEENGLRGGKKYAEEAKLNHENNIAALESDSGGFTPRGFSIGSTANNYKLFLGWKKLLSPYGLNDFSVGHAGSDIGPLKSDSISLFGYRPDSQRYFDYHHTAIDTFDKVNKRELELGAASMTSLVYLLDKYLN
ncbi:MAG: M20/M25/M40 family metallo-hydrolase [Lutibacter sp.]|uniref:M20/M25/M40 family metallo-hydrolase n=1 Tax=Lutibacter sp. TaxID=1925666 RepID=UPI00299E3D21|nr:M20/M25/M40 family metallo-hydrolase [Lutibacter sp.]MDX1829028.1 M20/M25/M40 family metallo-hydrolase [Lutibacter sp.]